MPHLFVSVSGHGFGHLAQISPLINALAERHPGLRISLQSDLPDEFVARRLRRVDQRYREIVDTGMVMNSALDVDVEASLDAYRRLDLQSESHLARQIDLLRAARPDLLIADIPYLPLRAAQSLGLPNVALCSLNWADILQAYCGERDEASAIIDGLRSIYSAADLFIRSAPSMPMEWLPNGVSVGPIIEGGVNRRDELIAQLGVPADTRLVMVNLGGVTHGIDPSAWRVPPGHCWLSQGGWVAMNNGLTDYQALPMAFSDQLASVDVLLTKPGYGMFTEAALHGLPVLTVARGDWPEEPYLEAWMRERVAFEVLPRERFTKGYFVEALDGLIEHGRRQGTPASGIDEAVALIEPYLS